MAVLAPSAGTPASAVDDRATSPVTLDALDSLTGIGSVTYVPSARFALAGGLLPLIEPAAPAVVDTQGSWGVLA